MPGEDSSNPPPLTPNEKTEITRRLQPSGFDPVPPLAQMTVPGIWVYGRQDRSPSRAVGGWHARTQVQ